MYKIITATLSTRLTCIGVAEDANVVNPQMSESNTVMHE